VRARLAWLSVANAGPGTPSPAAIAATGQAEDTEALVGTPDPASTSGYAAAAATGTTSTTPTRCWSPGRVHIYHPRKATRKRAPGTGALSEIRHYEHDGGLLVQTLPFQRLCREIMDKIVYYDARKIKRETPTRFQTSAIMALQ
jgi:hypothetical protein